MPSIHHSSPIPYIWYPPILSPIFPRTTIKATTISSPSSLRLTFSNPHLKTKAKQKQSYHPITQKNPGPQKNKNSNKKLTKVSPTKINQNTNMQSVSSSNSHVENDKMAMELFDVILQLAPMKPRPYPPCPKPIKK